MINKTLWVAAGLASCVFLGVNESASAVQQGPHGTAVVSSGTLYLVGSRYAYPWFDPSVIKNFTIISADACVLKKSYIPVNFPTHQVEALSFTVAVTPGHDCSLKVGDSIGFLKFTFHLIGNGPVTQLKIAPSRYEFAFGTTQAPQSSFNTTSQILPGTCGAGNTCNLYVAKSGMPAATKK